VGHRKSPQTGDIGLIRLRLSGLQDITVRILTRKTVRDHAPWSPLKFTHSTAKGLVDKRKERLLLVRSRFDLILSLIELGFDLESHENSNPTARSRAKKSLQIGKDLREREIGSLKTLMHPSQPYALMVRQFMIEFLKRIRTAA
jgi:hypothetical protein